MTAAAARVLAETAEKGRDLPVPPWVVGVGAFVALVALLLVTLSFGKDR
jgi:hypothetical protein